MKKIVSVFVILSLTCMFMGCGSEKEEDKAAKEEITESVEETKVETKNPFLEDQRKWYDSIEKEIEDFKIHLYSPASLKISSVIVVIEEHNSANPRTFIEFSSESSDGTTRSMYGELTTDSVMGYVYRTDENPKGSDPQYYYNEYYKILHGKNENYTDEGYGVFTCINKKGKKVTVFALDIDDYVEEGYMYLEEK